MCLARLMFSDKAENDEKSFADIAWVQTTKDGLLVTDLLGEKRTIQAEIKSIDFMESAIVVEKKERE